ncbi:MAG TPA: cytochrome P450 [Acidimicrobiales bacterium]|nr:cytochrome P450 [Acidimicrobiales bacterium]
MEPQQTLALDEIDLSDIELWTRPLAEREGAFLTLREQDPIRFFQEPDLESEILPRGPGYWSLTRHADVLEASKHPDLFCSGKGTNIGDLPEPFLEFLGSMINMDDPRHARLRRIVSRGFTPKQLDSMKADVESIAAGIVDDVIERGEGDFVTDVAATLPLRIIVDMMGIPRSQERFIFDRTNVILGLADEEYVPEQTESGIVGALLGAAQDLTLLITELGEARVEEPQDDLTTALVTAEVDGESLSPAELASFFVLLVVAGNETTRNAISHGLLALTEHPDQLAAWQADFDGLAPTAVEEIVRWATPVIHFRRTVTQDGARLGDHEFAAGDKVVLWYASANRDAAVFDDPFRFDLTRTPNDHLGFGGPGPHFCLGAHLARREITVMFRELLRRMPDLRAAGEPVRLRSNFINGIKHLPASWTPAPAA